MNAVTSWKRARAEQHANAMKVHKIYTKKHQNKHKQANKIATTTLSEFNAVSFRGP